MLVHIRTGLPSGFNTVKLSLESSRYHMHLDESRPLHAFVNW